MNLQEKLERMAVTSFERRLLQHLLAANETTEEDDGAPAAPPEADSPQGPAPGTESRPLPDSQQLGSAAHAQSGRFAAWRPLLRASYGSTCTFTDPCFLSLAVAYARATSSSGKRCVTSGATSAACWTI